MTAGREGCHVLTLLHTPVELSQNVIQQDIIEGLKVLGEDITDGVKCMVAGGGHPLCFLRVQHNHIRSKPTAQYCSVDNVFLIFEIFICNNRS